MAETEKITLLPRDFSKVVLTQDNVLLSDEKLSTTPSMLDGLDRDTEWDLRILGCELIQTSGILLKLPQVAMAAGQVLFQRFYFSKSFVKHGMEIVAMACINLAAKIEEAPRRIRDVINVFHHVKQVRNGKTIAPLVLDQNYISLKNQVIKAERRVLKELGFCVHVQHPHKMIVMFLQVLECERNQKLVQCAWNYMNDSFRSVVFVKHSPETIACACIYLAARQLQICLPNSPPWYHIFKVSRSDMVDICVHILRLYNRKKPNVDELDKLVNERKKVNLEAKLLVKGLTSDGATPNSRPVSPAAAAKDSPAGSEVLAVKKLKEEGVASDSSVGHDAHNGRHRKKRTRSASYSSSRSQSRSPRGGSHRHSHGKKHRKESHHNNNVNKYRSSSDKYYHEKHSKEHNDRYAKHEDDHWSRSPRPSQKKYKHRSRSRSPHDRHRSSSSSSRKHNGRSKDRYSSRR